MSESIIESGADLTVFEIDPAYCSWLKESLEPRGIRIIPGDVTKNWIAAWDDSPPDRVLGNLPYNAASAIIAAFIENRRMAPISVFTVQDEMGQRMTSQAGTKNYSSFTVLCRTSAVIGDGGRLTPGSFYPAPRVRSRIVTVRPASPCGEISDPRQFRLIVRSLFGSRRKTLLNNLKASSGISGFPDRDKLSQAFSDESIDLSRRPETVEPCQWVAVANRVSMS